MIIIIKKKHTLFIEFTQIFKMRAYAYSLHDILTSNIHGNKNRISLFLLIYEHLVT